MTSTTLKTKRLPNFSRKLKNTQDGSLDKSTQGRVGDNSITKLHDSGLYAYVKTRLNMCLTLLCKFIQYTT